MRNPANPGRPRRLHGDQQEVVEAVAVEPGGGVEHGPPRLRVDRRGDPVGDLPVQLGEPILPAPLPRCTPPPPVAAVLLPRAFNVRSRFVVLP